MVECVIVINLAMRRRAFLVSGALLLVALAAWVCVVPLHADDDPPAPARPLTVTFLDIGQGDSALIETPDGHAVLIDGGEGQTPDAAELYPFDAGRRVVLPVLRKKGIATLDLVIATHPHSDHLGGLVDVLADTSVTVKELWQSGCTTWDYPSYQKLQKVVAERKIPGRTPAEGETVDWGGGARATVLHIDSTAKGMNDTSIAVRLQYGGTSFLFTGDCEKDSEAAMVERHGKELASTVLKVGHHGSKTSSTAPFLAAVTPKFAVISCGAYNGYGHPRPETLEALEKCGAKIYRTDRDSHVQTRSDGKSVSFATAAADHLDLPQAGFDAPEITPADITGNVGKWVRMRGKVTDLRKAGDSGTYILTVGEKATVVILKGVSRLMADDGVPLDDLKGREVSLAGLVQDHKKYGIQIVVGCKSLFHLTP